MIEIDRSYLRTAREVGRVLFARSPNPHPPTHHLTFACARPLSRQVFSTPPLSRAQPTHVLLSTAQRKGNVAVAAARVRTLRSTGLLLFF